jgi:hypothetical protein
MNGRWGERGKGRKGERETSVGLDFGIVLPPAAQPNGFAF